MTQLTPQQLQLYETRPHRTKLWLSIYQPETRLSALVDDVSIQSKAVSIPYLTLGGSYTNVEPGMTVYIGSSAGASDKGILRIRSIDDSNIDVAENTVQWSNGDHLTVLNFFEINAVFPRNIQDPNNELNVIFYKDYNIAYTDQNIINGCFMCMGPNHAGFLTTGTHQVFYSASGTSHVNTNDSPSSYSWWFQGADTTGSASLSPGYISYSSPGHYMTRLIVSGSNGSVDTSYRHVSIYDRPGQGSSTPILSWSLDELSGSRDQGGYTGKITVRESVSDSILRNGALVVIFADDWYGNTKQSIGGNAENRSEIFFVGYVLDDTIEYDYRQNSVSFSVGSPTELMKLTEVFSISLDDQDNPVNAAIGDPNLPPWAVMKQMNVKKSLWHYLRWHSTCIQTMDIQYIADADFPLQYFVSNRESLYDGMNNHIGSTLVGNTVSDRQGKLWFEREASVIGLNESVMPNTFTLNNDKWANEPVLNETVHTPLSFVEFGAIIYNGATGTFQPVLSNAPGVSSDNQAIPRYRGTPLSINGLAVDTQASLNDYCGNYFAYENIQFPEVSFDLSGNFRNLDIVPQETTYINLSEDDTFRGLTWTNKKFSIRELIYNYRGDREFLACSSVLHELAEGDGETVVVPNNPTVDGIESPNPWGNPPIPPIPNPIPYEGEVIVRNTPPLSSSLTGLNAPRPAKGWHTLSNISSIPNSIIPVGVYDNDSFAGFASSETYYMFINEERGDLAMHRGDFLGVSGSVDTITVRTFGDNFTPRSGIVMLSDSVGGCKIFNNDDAQYEMYFCNFDATASGTVALKQVVQQTEGASTRVDMATINAVEIDGEIIVITPYYKASINPPYSGVWEIYFYNFTTDTNLGSIEVEYGGQDLSSPSVYSNPVILADRIIYPISAIVNNEPYASTTDQQVFVLDINVRTKLGVPNLWTKSTSYDFEAIYSAPDYKRNVAYFSCDPPDGYLTLYPGYLWSDPFDASGEGPELLYNRYYAFTKYPIPSEEKSLISIIGETTQFELVTDRLLYEGICQYVDDVEFRIWFYLPAFGIILGQSVIGSPGRTIYLTSVITELEDQSFIDLDIQGTRAFLTIPNTDDDTITVYVII